MSDDRDGSLLELASSISDGVPLDWNRIAAAASSDSLRRRQSCFKIVATIAEVHRGVSSNPGTSELGLWGRLEIREKIGRGGFGEVYRAWDPDLRREVALKLASSGEHENAAIKEARALARLRHNNVVTVYGVDRHDDRVGLWMDLIRGRTLESILKDQGPLGGREAALVGVELCRALAAVHAKRLVHGDVKAQNVMREEGGRIVLMDFGLVRKSADDGSNPDRIAGTPMYMAPELMRGDRPSVRSDIFALGVMLYHLVTGAFPSSGKNRDAARYAGNAKLLHDLRPDLQENFVQAIERAVAADPSDRFGSAGEMSRSLAGSLGSDRPVVPASGMPRRLLRRAFFPALALLTAVAIVFLLYWMMRGIVPTVRSGSIAVLFENLNSDPDIEYLSAGIADDVTSRLTRVKSLRVVVAQWNALRRLKAHEDLSEIARELRVSTLLEGTVRKTGDTIRVSVKLIDPKSRSYLWSETYERDLQSVLGLGAEISQAVVPRVATQFAGMQLLEVSRSRTANAEAYQLYLRGRYHFNKRSPEEMKKAIEYFQHAVTIDPTYALAYSGLADCYSTLVDFGSLPAREGMPVAKSAALRARDLDDFLAEAHTSLGFIQSAYDWDWSAAEASFERALQLNPGYAMAHAWYARFLQQTGQVDMAVIEGKRAADLDPLSLPMNSALGTYLYYARRYADAREQLDKTLELDANYMQAHFWLGRVYIRQGKFTEALAESAKMASGLTDQQWPQFLAAEAYAVSGRQADAANIIHEWELRRQQSPIAPSFFALVYSSMGEKQLTLEWLNRAYDERDSSLLTAQTHPSYDWLRSDAQFKELFRRMGLPFKPLLTPRN